jgi:hypothetical protein
MLLVDDDIEEFYLSSNEKLASLMGVGPLH